MKLSNFKLTETKGENALNWEAFATVDVRHWFKTTSRKIRKEFARCWHFVDNGESTPGIQAETLARAWEAQNGVMFKKT